MNLGLEPNDTSMFDTLKREIMEEAQMTMSNPVLLDVLEITSDLIGAADRKYIVIYAGIVKEMGDFVSTDEISERLVLNGDQFAEQYFGNAPITSGIFSK